MAHLRNRFCLIPFCDLSDCPESGHHAIGSPYFDSHGLPLFPDPIVIAVRADITDESLPRCTALGASCNTRPYHSYGPVIRNVFEKSRPHDFPEVRRGMEGVMELGDVQKIPPGGLEHQADCILLGCVATMTAGTNEQILQEVLQNFSASFVKLPAGATLRMPLIGTGKAREGQPTEDIYREVVNLTISNFYPTLLPEDRRIIPRRLLLVHPLEYESQLIATALGERGIFLTLLDKMGLLTTDNRLVYGLGHGNVPEKRFADEENFYRALDCLDGALDFLLADKRKKALQEAAKAVEIDPMMSGMFLYVHSLATQKKGLLHAVSKEALALAKDGRIGDALAVAQSLTTLGAGKKERAFIASLKKCYLDYCIAGLEAQLLYENYMQAEEKIADIYQQIAPDSRPDQKSGANILKLSTVDFSNLEQIKKKIPERLVENTFHIVIRKFMADRIEFVGARRALDNLLELQKHNRVDLGEQDEKTCQRLHQLADYIEERQEILDPRLLHKEILERLLDILSDHGTLRLEAARYFLKGEAPKEKSRANVLTRSDINQAWDHLQHGRQKNPSDYGILAYLGLVILLQGQRCLSLGEEFYMLFARLIDQELSRGKFGIRSLKSPQGETVNVPIRDSYTSQAHEYYEQYRNAAQTFAHLAKALANAEGTASLNLYRRALHMLSEVGRYDLVLLYERILGETWVALLSRSQQSMGAIQLPFLGELSIDFIYNTYKKIRRWWKYRNLSSPEIKEAIGSLIKDIGKRLS